MYDTHARSNHLYVSTWSALYLSHSALGVKFSFNACVSVAVPYSSVPQMKSVRRLRVPARCVDPHARALNADSDTYESI